MILPPMGAAEFMAGTMRLDGPRNSGARNSLDEIAEVKPLRGACEGLTEIIIVFRVVTTKIRIRILGFADPARHAFTLLIGFGKG